MRSGSAFPRARFERALDADAGVVAALYTGSLGAGRADAYSDIDVDVVLDPGVADPRAKLETLCEALGRVRFWYWRDRLLTAFVGSGWQRVDLRHLSETELDPSPRFASARVVKDRAGHASAVVAASLAPRPMLAATDAWHELALAIDTQIYAALHVARGALFSAQGELAHRAQTLYALLARLRGVETFGFRRAEELLARRERACLERAWPRAPLRRELRRAARALWDWTELVRAEASARLGAEAAPEVDAADLLRAVRAIHGSAHRGARA